MRCKPTVSERERKLQPRANRHRMAVAVAMPPSPAMTQAIMSRSTGSFHIACHLDKVTLLPTHLPLHNLLQAKPQEQWQNTHPPPAHHPPPSQQAGKPSGTPSTRPGSTPTPSPKKPHGRSPPSPPMHPESSRLQARRQGMTTAAIQMPRDLRKEDWVAIIPTARMRMRAMRRWRGGCRRRSRIGSREVGVLRMTFMVEDSSRAGMVSRRTGSKRMANRAVVHRLMDSSNSRHAMMEPERKVSSRNSQEN